MCPHADRAADRRHLRPDLQRRRGLRCRGDSPVGGMRKLAAALGWQVAGEYVDNDLSASSDKRRPEYERMLADIADGVVDGVVVYNIDRLTRRPAELQAFASAVERAGVRQVKFVTGDVDTGTDDERMMARIMGAFAAKESANIARRVRHKMEQVAAEGRPHGGSRRPFGYAPDMVHCPGGSSDNPDTRGAVPGRRESTR